MDNIAKSLYSEFSCYIEKGVFHGDEEKIFKDKLKIFCFYVSIQEINEFIEKLKDIQEVIDHGFRESQKCVYDDNDYSTVSGEKSSRERELESMIKFVEKLKESKAKFKVKWQEIVYDEFDNYEGSNIYDIEIEADSFEKAKVVASQNIKDWFDKNRDFTHGWFESHIISITDSKTNEVHKFSGEAKGHSLTIISSD